MYLQIASFISKSQYHDVISMELASSEPQMACFPRAISIKWRGFSCNMTTMLVVVVTQRNTVTSKKVWCTDIGLNSPYPSQAQNPTNGGYNFSMVIHTENGNLH